MARPIESQLYRELVDSRFNFIERGTVEIGDIYNAVQRQYPHLCDDDFLCTHRQEAPTPQAEWKHIVRSALQRCKAPPDTIVFSGRRGYWVFT